MKHVARAVMICAGLGLCTSAQLSHAQENAGAYLASRAASMDNNFDVAADYFVRALAQDPTNPTLLEGALASYVGTGDLDRSVLVAQTMVGQGINSQLANMVLLTHAAKTENWDAILTSQEAGQLVGPLVDGSARAWALIGQGRMTDGLSAFDELIEAENGSRAFGLYLKAMALASVGDFEGADAILGLSPMQGMQRTRRSTLAHARVLSGMDRNIDALALLEAVFGNTNDADVTELKAHLTAGDRIPFALIQSPIEGLAETFHTVASVLEGETDDFNTLIYARLATELAPDNTQALLLCARMLEELERYELADATYRRIPQSDPAYETAELGRAKVLIRADRREAAIEVLQSLVRADDNQPLVHATMGDTFRAMGQMQNSNDSYSHALSMMGPNAPARWFVLYSRAITYHELNNWPAAEADFRASLAINPQEARVLNYLGYSLVERQENMDEALEMIERAAAAEPQSGAIIDSLGWVLYRMGRYTESVTYMERAASLLPTDPTINDHLGDSYWAVGRVIEARFQWNRAMSFDPTPEIATRIRRKLEVGLDQVLADEGATPLHVAANNGG